MTIRRMPSTLTLRNAAENASTEPVTDVQVVAILYSGDGRGSHVRGIFGDVWLSARARAGRSNEIELETILAAFATAHREHCAANPELDRVLTGR